MPVFFIDSHHINNDTITVDTELAAHLCKSLRIQRGEIVTFADAQRQRYRTEVTHITGRLIQARILERITGPTATTSKVIIAQAILKGAHMNWMVQKATELGASAILPVISARVVVRPSSAKYASLQERYRRIALDAAQQSERWDIPEIHAPISFTHVFEHERHGAFNAILVERSGYPRLSVTLQEQLKRSDCLIMIGPEGGWTDEEVNLACLRGFAPVSLGERILRGETAAVAALCVHQHHVGELG